MEKLRQEKSKRRSLHKPVQSEAPIVQLDKRQVEIKQLMSENKELLKRCDETLTKQLDIACEIGANELDKAKEDLDATIARSRKILEEMDDGTLTETEDLDDIRLVLSCWYLSFELIKEETHATSTICPSGIYRNNPERL